MKAVIMAGGFGTRLRPITCNIPKPMIPIVNKPVMEHIIELLKKNGLTDILAILYFQPEIIQDYFEDGSNFGVKISYVIAEEDLGTAGSVKNAEGQLKETFLIISGDLLTDINLKELIKFHRERKALLTIGLTRVENPLPFGVIITDKKGKIERFLEKPTWGEVFSDTINTGIYVLEPRALSYIPPEKEFDFSKDLFPLLLQRKEPLYGYIASGYWKDIGDLNEYRLANYDALRGKMALNIPGNKIIEGIDRFVWAGAETIIHPTASLKGVVVLGNNCQVGAKVRIVDSAIGDNCTIEDGVHITNSVIWDNVHIGNEAVLEENIVGRNVEIRAKACLSEEAIVSDNCIVGEGSIIKAEVKMWPGKVLEDGAILATSLVWGERWSKSLFSAYGVVGLANIEITPEFAAKLGAAYGASMPKGFYVITSRDSHKTCRMINRAIISGILSSGVHVQDLGVTPIPVARYELGTLGANGGIHVRKSPYDPELIDIKFYGADRMSLPPSKEKGVERLFFREDFRRARMEETGELTFPARAVEHYRAVFLSNIDKSLIREANFRIVIDYAFGSSSLIFPSILGQLGCEAIALNAHIDASRITKTLEEFEQSLRLLSSIVVSLKADAGFLFDAGGEKLFLVDEKGRILSGDLALILVSLLVLKANPGATIAVPVSASSAIDLLAKEYKGRVIRTKTSYRSMEEIACQKDIFFVGENKGGYIFPRFQPVFDAMVATGEILELMAKADLNLSELVKTIPKLYMVKEHVHCPWELKGTVMRNLIEETKDMDVQLIDGVKVRHGEDWVIIIPDSDRPLFHVNAEARSRSLARRLVQRCVRKIKKWQK